MAHATAAMETMLRKMIAAVCASILFDQLSTVCDIAHRRPRLKGDIF
jgi:hypothetical protein